MRRSWKLIKGQHIAALAFLAMAWPALAAAQDDFTDGRIRYLEPGVTVQRGTESGAEEAAVNVPFLPGDRVWTDGGGRAEFQFADGSVVRLDSRSKFEYVAHDAGSDDRVVLRLWSGSLLLRSRDGGNISDFAVETPGGLVETRDRGVFRVDVADGEVRLSVHDGRATLDSDHRPVAVEAGERSYARGGEHPESPRRFDTAESDDFAQWNTGRDSRDAWAGDTRRYVPDEVAPYAGELDSHGSWYYQAEVGYVWRPYVAPDWRPYSSGRWTWTQYGWTWVPYDAWGWAPSHYGRWGYSGALGWYWIPGHVWGPAWVSWSVGGDYVGWCPLGAGDRPVVAVGSSSRGFAVARGATNDSGWNYARRTEIESRDPKRRSVEVPPSVTRELRMADSPRARPSRDFRRVSEVEATAPRAVPRNANLKPTVGDFVPEVRDTTIPVLAPGYSVSRERYQSGTVERRSSRESASPRPPSRAGESGSTQRTRPTTFDDRRRPPASYDSGRHPTDARYPSTRSAPPPSSSTKDAPQRTGRPQPTQREREAQPNDQRRSEPSTDREVLRNMFRPLSDAPRGGDTRSAPPRSQPTPTPPRAEPRQRTPPSPRATPPSPRATARPTKDQQKPHR